MGEGCKESGDTQSYSLVMEDNKGGMQTVIKTVGKEIGILITALGKYPVCVHVLKYAQKEHLHTG